MADFSTSASPEDSPKRTGRSSRRKAVPKLRDSCTGCAASKVRCTKEKPACSRCSRRNIKCEYIVTRRTGRTSSRSSQNVPRVPHLLALRQPHCDEDDVDEGFNDSFTVSSALSASAMPVLTPSSSGYASPPPPIHPISGIAAPGIGETPSTAYMSLASNIDAMFDTAGTLSLDESPMTKAGTYFGHLVPEDLSTCSRPDFSPTSQPMPGPYQMFGELASSGRSQSCSSFASTSCCVDIAVGHMIRLTAAASAMCRRTNSTIVANLFHGVHATIAENRQIVESVRSILDCACSDDDYILSVLSLVILKVMAWYTIAARAKPCMTPEYSFPGGHSLSSSGTDRAQSARLHELSGMSDMSAGGGVGVSNYCGHTAAQMVLDELHGVREVVHLVSKRMQAKIARASPMLDAGLRYGDVSEDNLLNGLTQIPSATFDRLEKDLQLRLHEMTLEVIDIVRRD